jgi:cardiolipin synthase A/B
MNFLGFSALTLAISTIPIAIVIVLDNRNPSRTMAWLLILIFLPFIGIFFYLIFGQNHRKKKTFMKKKKQDYRIAQFLKENRIEYSGQDKLNGSAYDDVRGHVLPLMLNNGDAPVTVNNRSQVFNNGEAAFDAMLKDIENAKHHIHMEYFIVKDSKIGRIFQEILIKKAREGVEVRLIYDHLGSWKLSKSFVKELEEAGVQVKPFQRVTFPFIAAHRFNYRNHRKILVVDGTVGYTGGLNLGDEYLGEDPKLGYWRDTHVKIEGEAVYELQVIYLRDWNFVSGQELKSSEYFPRVSKIGSQLIQVSSSGPDSEWTAIHQGYFTAITSAVDRLYICTPYLVLDEGTLLALQTAGLRGVDVRILIPAESDHRVVDLASKSYFEELMKSGVRIYLYQKGFIHSKIMLADDYFSSIGTTNLNTRSFELDFEVNAFYYDKEMNQQLTGIFFEDLKDSSEVRHKDYQTRALSQRIKESAARLLSPVL